MKGVTHMRILPIAAVIALAMTSSALAVTESTQDPVQITACVVNSPITTSVSVMVPNVSLTNGVTVTMVNRSNKVVTGVTVTGEYHGRHVTDSANFKLPPGGMVSVTRHYTQSGYIDADARCRVLHVDFADGTSWSAPGQ